MFCITSIAGETLESFNRSRFRNLPSTQVALLEEYLDSYNKLKKYYQGATIVAFGTEFRLPQTEDGLPIRTPSTDLVPVFSMEWKFQSHDSRYYRLDGRKLSADGTTVEEELTGIIRPDESYLLGKDQESGKHYLKAHGKNREEYMGILRSYVFSNAPFSFGPRLLEYEVFAPFGNKQIVSVELNDEDENSPEAVAIVTTQIESDKGSVMTRIQLWRNRCWAVKRIDSTARRQSEKGNVVSQSFQECEYNGDRNGVPILKRVLQETRSGYAEDDSLLLRRRNVIDVSSVSAGPSDLKPFNVDGLIPEFQRVGQTTPSRRSWFLFLNGLILLVIGVVASRRARKRTAA